MHDPRTFWLTVTNIALGVALVLLILGILTGSVCDLVARLKRRHTLSDDIDREMHRMFHGPGKT
jgi:hypothetical protein